MPKSETPSISNGGCVRCAICGNENAETNYFCGMCGAALTEKKPRPVQPSAQVPAAPAPAAPAAPRPEPPAAPPVQRQTAPPLRTTIPALDRAPANSHREQTSEPVITGPSFLGLNAPAPRSGTRDSARDHSLSPGSHAHDHLQHSSGNLDYLLDDDEEQPKGGWGKLIVVLVALLLALGFGYLRWRQGGFDWLTGRKNPAVVAPATSAPQGSSSGDSTSTPTPSTPNPATDAAATPAATTPGQTTQPAVDPSTPATTSGSGAPVATSPDSTAPQTNPPANAVQTQTSPAQPPSDSHPSDSNAGADSAPSTAQPSDSDSETRPSQAKAPKPRQTKPSPAKPIDTVNVAERYIYGRGTRQDCDQGLRLLKPAAVQSNTKAMISLATLYTTGTCTPRDLPTAYRWFALALHKEPDNQALQGDLQKLWSQMTPPERQLAIKLSQ
jgi:hypothetical protein